jgi:UDP-2,3-diacylglucosamine pyrophosphatase LpxH
VIHGDHFDMIVKYARWVALLGDHTYRVALVVNTVFNAVRRRLGLTYWSLSQWAKLKVKNAVSHIGEFEKTLCAEAHRHAVDGVICGHIHHAAIHERFAVRYVNCGDWVESCTAVAEHADGGFEILTWSIDLSGADEPAPVAAARAA